MTFGVQAGDRVGGRYLLLSTLGEGGMAVVFEALDEHLQRRVALKVLRKADDVFAARFEREARAASALSHPAVVKVFGFGTLETGQPYLALEFIEGEMLIQALHRDGPFPPDRALQLLLPVVGALAEAHAAGIVHRDIKPSNLMMQHAAGQYESVRLLDFGIASWDTGTRLTRTGEVFGTPEFMAPEQATSQPVSPATDVWAIGAVLHEMLAGTPPFVGNNPPSILYKVVNEAPTPLPDHVPPELEELIHACLEKAQSRRPRDGQALLDRMEALLLPARRELVSSRPPSMAPAPILASSASLAPMAITAPRPTPEPLSRAISTERLSPEPAQQAPRRPIIDWALPGVLIAGAVFTIWWTMRPAPPPESPTVVAAALRPDVEPVTARAQDAAVGPAATPTRPPDAAPPSVGPDAAPPSANRDVAPASVAPASVAPASVAPASVAPASVAPASVAPASVATVTTAAAPSAPPPKLKFAANLERPRALLEEGKYKAVINWLAQHRGGARSARRQLMFHARVGRHDMGRAATVLRQMLASDPASVDAPMQESLLRALRTERYWRTLVPWMAHKKLFPRLQDRLLEMTRTGPTATRERAVEVITRAKGDWRRAKANVVIENLGDADSCADRRRLVKKLGQIGHRLALPVLEMQRAGRDNSCMGGAIDEAVAAIDGRNEDTPD